MGLALLVSLRRDTCCLSWLCCTETEKSLLKGEKNFSRHERVAEV